MEHWICRTCGTQFPAGEAQRMRDKVEPLAFERLYGAWFERIVMQDAHAAVPRSADRYIRALQNVLDERSN